MQNFSQLFAPGHHFQVLPGQGTQSQTKYISPPRPTRIRSGGGRHIPGQTAVQDTGEQPMLPHAAAAITTEAASGLDSATR